MQYQLRILNDEKQDLIANRQSTETYLYHLPYYSGHMYEYVEIYFITYQPTFIAKFTTHGFIKELTLKFICKADKSWVKQQVK